MRNFVFKSVVSCLSLALVCSCSKDRLDEGDRELTKKSDITDYLDDFYGSSYSIGSNIETTDETSRTFDVYPVTLSEDSEARGYLAVDPTSEELVYFIDVDRTNYILTTEDIGLSETVHYEAINEYEQWESTDEFDFMSIINDHNNDPDPPQGRKFWGHSDWEYNDCNNGLQTRTRQHYVFWVKNGPPDLEVVGC